jgi:GcrA cell cycle regulator
LLKRRWAQGVTAAAIAKELGPRVSRNAVIGKLKRLDVPRRRGGRKHAVGARRGAHLITSIAARRCGLNLAFEAFFAASRFARLVRPVHERVVHPDASRPFGPPCTLMELGSSTCRWPVGEPGAAGFLFCGAVSLEARPYCAAHDRIARRPPGVAAAIVRAA